MCKISDYAGLLARANATVRGEKINPEIPGYELLKRAIVVYKVEKGISKEDLLREVTTGLLIPANKDLNLADKGERGETEQWMIEAAKSVGVDIPLMDYIKQLADETP